MNVLEKTSLLKRLWRLLVLRHILYWIFAFFALYITVRIFGAHKIALAISVTVVLPGPIPVYAHFFVLKTCFEEKRYILYFTAIFIIAVGSGLLIEFVFQAIEKSPGSHINGIAVALFLIVFTTALRTYVQGLRQKALLHEAESSQAKTELSLLKSQINPHFFFNTLNSLYSLSLNKSGNVPAVILKLSELMRYMLDSSKKKAVPLHEEVRFIKNYIELEKLRLSGNTKIRFQANGNLKGKSIAPLLFIPFVENSFKHGMHESLKGGFVHIDLNVGEKEISFAAENSKPACSLKKERRGSPTGLANVKRRLEILYPGTHRLKVLEEDNRYRIELNLWP